VEYDESLGPSSSRWWEFEQFVRHILQAMPGVEIRDAGGDAAVVRKDSGFDLEAVRNGRPLLVQIKTQTPQTSARLATWPTSCVQRPTGMRTRLAGAGGSDALSW
jgi:hypothetical protein